MELSLIRRLNGVVMAIGLLLLVRAGPWLMIAAAHTPGARGYSTVTRSLMRS